MTVTLDSDMSKIVLVVLVVFLGGIGGLCAELLKVRKIGGVDEEGILEKSKRLTGRFYDVGTPATVFLGAVAAALAMGVFDPVTEVPVSTDTAAASAEEPKEQYDIWRLCLLCIVAGFTAPKFLTTLQERFLALVTAEKVQSRLDAAAEVAKNADNPNAAVQAVLEAPSRPPGG